VRIDVDWDRCEGHGICADQAPKVFSLDDEGELHYAFDNDDIPDDLAPSARSAIGVCPVAALREQA
jgi:ferredoxin